MISFLAAAKISLCFGQHNGVVAVTALSFQWLYVIFYCTDIPMIWWSNMFCICITLCWINHVWVWVWVYGTVMFSQKLCKARIRSFLKTDMTLAISLPIKSHTCSIILRSVVWNGHWLVDISCCSNHVTVRSVMGAGSLSCLNTSGWFLSPNMFLQIHEGFLTMFWHNCPHSRFHR